MSKDNEPFDKEVAINHILKFFSECGDPPSIIKQMQAMVKSMDYLQALHDDAYTQGFNTCLKAQESTDNLNKDEK